MEAMKKSNWKNAKGDISLHLPSGIYYVRKKFLRQKIPMLFKSTGETKQHLAKTKAIDFIKAHLDVHLKRTKTFGQVADEFLRFENPNLNKRRISSQNNNAMVMSELKNELGPNPITQVADESFFSEWLQGFMGRKDRKTFNDYIIRVNMLMRFAHRRKYLPTIVKFDFVDEVKESGRVLSQAELGAIFDSMSENGRDQFTLAYECAMRLREMLSLTWDRVNLETGKVTLGKDDVKTGRKTGKGRSFLLSEESLKRLRARKEKSGASPFVFPSKSNLSKPQRQNKSMWKRAKREARIQGRCRWHDIRHTAVSHMVADPTQSIILISKYVGASVRTLEKVYVHTTAEETRPVSGALKLRK